MRDELAQLRRAIRPYRLHSACVSGYADQLLQTQARA